MMSERAGADGGHSSNSFALDLKKWASIMAAYEGGRARLSRDHADGLPAPVPRYAERDARLRLRRGQGRAMGARARGSGAAGERASCRSRPAGWEAPSVVVCFTEDPEIQTGRRFAAEGCRSRRGAPAGGRARGFRSFRIGPLRARQAPGRGGTVERFRAWRTGSWLKAGRFGVAAGRGNSMGGPSH
jgi:hypothetical protein